jgi:hypothetical protein
MPSIKLLLKGDLVDLPLTVLLVDKQSWVRTVPYARFIYVQRQRLACYATMPSLRRG